MPGLLREMRECFDRFPRYHPVRLSDDGTCNFLPEDTIVAKVRTIGSLGESTVQAKNLKSLFGVKRPPSDTWLRERHDGVDPRSLRRCFKNIL